MREATARSTFLATLVLPILLGAAAPPPDSPTCSSVVIDVTIDPARGTLDETLSLVVEGRGTSRLTFALDEGLGVKSARTSTGVIDYRQAGDALIVDLDPPLDGPRTLTFRIGGQPGTRTETQIGPQRAILAPSTPWYPRLDGLRATTSVTVRVPAGWGAVAPGVPAPRPAHGTSTWRTGQAVRAIAVGAAPGLTVTEGSIVSTPFRLATTGSSPSVKAAAARLAPAMAWLSGALSPYAFDSFNLVMLPGYEGRVDAGGLAIVGRAAPLATDSDGADVLAGQWWGQMLGGDGAWIEAFAAWEGCVFARDRALPNPSDVEALRTAYFQLRSGDVPLASAPATAPPEVVRGKGSAAPDMIRLVAGDRATFDAMRELFAAPIGRPISLSSVRTMIEKHAGRSLERPFQEWFDRSGAPQFETSVRSFPVAGGGFRADVTIIQKRGVYNLPVDVVIYGPGGEKRETIEVSEEVTSIFYVVPFEPTRIELDPLNRIFRWK